MQVSPIIIYSHSLTNIIMYLQLDSKKVLEMGYYTCAHSHLQHLYNKDSSPHAIIRRATCGHNSSGLWRNDVFKQDRQNFMACVRRAGYKCRRGLIALQPVGPDNMTGQSPRFINRRFLPDHNTDPSTLPVLDAVFLGADDRPWGSPTETPEGIKTQGTVAFYVLCCAYMLIHNSMYFGILQRVRFAAYCNQFAAHWRCWVMRTPDLNLSDNFLTKEAYSDLVQSCHEAIFQIQVFAEFARSLPLGLIYSGSNVCENDFSSAGGYRGMHGTRNYTVLDYLNHVERTHLMRTLEAAGINRGRSQHKKQEWDSRAHEPRISAQDLQQLLLQHPEVDDIVCSWNAGAADATFFAKQLGLRHGVSAADWADPWTQMNEKLHVAEESSSEESDSSGDEYFDGYDPPANSTHGMLDLYVVVVQFMRSRHVLDTKLYKAVVLFLLSSPDICLTNFRDEVMCLAMDKHIKSNKERKRMREQRRANSRVTVPGTTVDMSKKQLTHLIVQDVLRNGRSDGTKPSKDRIKRIVLTSARVRQDEEDRDAPAVEGDFAHLQDDLAFGFKHNDGKFKVWIGKLQQIRGGPRTGNLHGPIDLCRPNKRYSLQLQWYHETRKGSGRYVPSRATKNLDRKFVSLKACLGLAVLKTHKNGVKTIVPNGQWERWQRNLKQM